MRILITGASGFISQALIPALLLQHPNADLTLTDIVEPTVPPLPSNHNPPPRCIKLDLTFPPAVILLLENNQFDVVFMLHGIMSSGSEADLDLGLRVNVDSCRLLLDTLRCKQPGIKVIFASSCAVYGPQKPGDVFDEETCPLPQSSYGTQKHMIETLLNDYSRRGLLDGRACRLPTVIVRPGAPSPAASAFVSGIVREPLKGERAVLPVQNEDMEVWVSSVPITIANLIAVMNVPQEKFAGYLTGRWINLPGQTVTVRQILEALEKVAGKGATALVEKKVDPEVEKIILSWPVRFRTTKALELGLKADISLDEIVKIAEQVLRKS